MRSFYDKPSKLALGLPRYAKRILAFSSDLLLTVLSVWIAFYLRLGEYVSYSHSFATALIVAVCLAVPIFALCGFYSAIFRHNGFSALMTVAKSMLIYGVIYSAIFTFYGLSEVPRTIGLIQPLILFFMVGFSRAAVRVWLGDKYLGIIKEAVRSKVLIYGAGRTGRQLAAAIAHSNEMKVVGFLDDDTTLQGQILNGVNIYKPNDLNILLEKKRVDSVLLAMPSLSRERRNLIIENLRDYKVSVRSVPKVTDLAIGKIGLSELQELDIDDLLGRVPVEPITELLHKNITGKVVLVTGAGGSIGSELCRQILLLRPAKLLLVEQNEFALYQIHQEAEKIVAGTQIVLLPLLASVCDKQRINDIFNTWRPDTIYHAAAYKHVPLVEHNLVVGVRNNAIGTMTVALAAIANSVSNFVLVSTDKAVRPTNVMGASKRLAELVLQALSADCSTTVFSMVRFGNVLGSSGSVVPKFRQQIREGGPITLTHLDITRYFMTIPEAAQLVIQAGAMARGGDVFVLDMGQSVKIIDLAKRMVELSGLSIRDDLNHDGDIEIKTTGLRPGEKLFEELLIGDDPQPTVHTRIMKAHENFIPWSSLEPKIVLLESCADINDVHRLRDVLHDLVPEYTPSDNIVDWIYMEKHELRI